MNPAAASPPASPPTGPAAPGGRSKLWKWWICGLLLCASTINYTDRVTLSTIATRITAQFHLTQENYGTIETGFGLAFAAGSLAFGLVSDRLPVRFVYPAALLLWSAAGFLTGFARNYQELLLCRILLGFFEGGHWPCAIKTTRWLLEPKDRSMGNSVLQSGTSIGAIITPLIMRVLLTDDPNSWRQAFQIIGAAGVVWIVAWFALVRRTDLASQTSRTTTTVPHPTQIGAAVTGESDSLFHAIFSRRMLVILVVIALINTWWQLLRAWLPKILQEGRGYTEKDMLSFLPAFYIATDVGVIAAGALTLWLHRRGATVHGARLGAFGAGAAMSAIAVVAAFTPHGPWLLAMLMVMGAGALGLFPIYHALTQDFPSKHQGTISGLGGVAAWALSPAQKYYGRLVDQTGSFDLGFAIAGAMPLAAFLVLALFWPREPGPDRTQPAPA